MVEIVLMGVICLLGAAYWWFKGWKPGDGEIAHPAHIDAMIERFEAELAVAETQEDRDNAAGRLAYWQREKRRG